MKSFRLACLLAAALSVGATSALAQPASKIKIGLVSTLSGPNGALGEEIRDAFNLAVQLNGGSLGGVPVEVLVADDQFNPQVGKQLFERMVKRDKVDFMTGVVFSNIMLAGLPEAVNEKVFYISPNAAPSPLAGKDCNPFFFVASWPNDAYHEMAGQHSTVRGFKSAYLLAPNYQAGKDFVAGFKRFYKGEVIDEIYTPLNQPDFAAELAQVAAKKPDAVYVFYPGGLGVNFVRQYQQAGLLGKIPLLSTSTTDGSTLPAQGEAALGVVSGTFWGPDFNNPASKRFVDEFEAKFKRIPSQYAAQSYDAAQLLDSAIGKVKGNVADKNAFRAALKAADFQSVRGSFKFNSNHFPIQDQHIFEVAKDAKGRVSLKTVATPLKNHGDAYAPLCKM